MNIEVVQESPEGLSRTVWVFGTHHWPHLSLTAYREQSRATKRHKFAGGCWNSYTSRDRSIDRPSYIPKSVIDDARGQLFDMISSANVYIGAAANNENIFQKGESK